MSDMRDAAAACVESMIPLFRDLRLSEIDACKEASRHVRKLARAHRVPLARWHAGKIRSLLGNVVRSHPALAVRLRRELDRMQAISATNPGCGVTAPCEPMASRLEPGGQFRTSRRAQMPLWPSEPDVA